MFHDTVMSLVVVSVIIGLAVDLEVDVVGAAHDGTAPGPARAEYTEPADPGTTSFIPRPDWYFYFLFYCCGSSSGRTTFLATVGVPTVALMLLSRCRSSTCARSGGCRAGRSRSSARVLVVLSMGILTWKGATASEFLGSGARARARRGMKAENNPDAALPGAGLFAVVRLPELPHVFELRGLEPRRARPDGRRHAEPRYRVADRTPDEPGEQDARIADAVLCAARAQDNLRKLAIFLEASKGPAGIALSPEPAAGQRRASTPHMTRDRGPPGDESARDSGALPPKAFGRCSTGSRRSTTR